MTTTVQSMATPSAWHPAAVISSPAMTTEQTPMTAAQTSQTLMTATKDATASGYERRVSSTILEEEYLEKFEGDSVRYIEIPELIEVPKYVPKKSQQIIEKKVPKYEVEYVEKVIEVPQIKYIDKYVEVPQVQEVIKHIPKKEVVNVNTEVIKHVPKIETRTVEKVVEVPSGEIIEVQKRFTVENRVIIPQIVDKEVPVVIAQSVHPHLRDSPDEVVDIDVVEHTPQVIEVEVQVPKPVGARIWAAGPGKSYHRVVKEVPAAQYNSLLKVLNPHLQTEQESSLPFMRDADGTVQMLSATQSVPYVELPADVKLVDDAGHEVYGTRGIINEIASQVQQQPQYQKSGSNQFPYGQTSNPYNQFSARGLPQSGVQSRSVPFNEDMGVQAASVTSSQRDSKKRYSSKRDVPSVSHSGTGKYGPPSTARKGTNTSRVTVPKKSRACAC